MTMTMKTLQVAMALALTSGSMVLAQEIVVNPGVKVNPEVKVIPEVKVTPMANVAGVDLHISGLNLQTNVAVNVAYQAKDDLFAGAEKFAQGASEVTEIDLDPTTMGLVGMSHGREGEEARKMKSMVIHTYKYDKPGMYRQEDVEAYRKKLDHGDWHCAIHVRTTTGSSDICSRTSADKQTNEMVILTAEPQKLTFIHMKGNMSMDELNEMSGSASHFRPQTGLPRGPMTTMPRGSREPKEKDKTVPPAPPAPAAVPAPPAPPGAI